MTDWNRYELHINSKLSEISQDLKDLKGSLAQTNIEVAKLQTQAKMSGFIFGAISGFISSLLTGWIPKGE